MEKSLQSYGASPLSYWITECYGVFTRSSKHPTIHV